uniref:Uncharacterized protein n=1 Tax=Romanomermis culicivorax TaxID=13658 RepID=A0A915JUK2_ROMCU
MEKHDVNQVRLGKIGQHVTTFMKMKLFGQQNNMNKTIIHNVPKEYFEFITNIVNIIKNVRLINEQLVSTTYCQHDDFTMVMGNTNAFIAAYTTAQAQLKLYSYIK